MGHIWRCIAIIIENDWIELDDTSAFELFFERAKDCANYDNVMIGKQTTIVHRT